MWSLSSDGPEWIARSRERTEKLHGRLTRHREDLSRHEERLSAAALAEGRNCLDEAMAHLAALRQALADADSQPSGVCIQEKA